MKYEPTIDDSSIKEPAESSRKYSAALLDASGSLIAFVVVEEEAGMKKRHLVPVSTASEKEILKGSLLRISAAAPPVRIYRLRNCTDPNTYHFNFSDKK